MGRKCWQTESRRQFGNYIVISGLHETALLMDWYHARAESYLSDRATTIIIGQFLFLRFLFSQVGGEAVDDTYRNFQVYPCPTSTFTFIRAMMQMINISVMSDFNPLPNILVRQFLSFLPPLPIKPFHTFYRSWSSNVIEVDSSSSLHN